MIVKEMQSACINPANTPTIKFFGTIQTIQVRLCETSKQFLSTPLDFSHFYRHRHDIIDDRIGTIQPNPV